ncbi:hypothetical protein ABWH74_002585 [Burkholderia vietnamiensis]
MLDAAFHAPGDDDAGLGEIASDSGADDGGYRLEQRWRRVDFLIGQIDPQKALSGGLFLFVRAMKKLLIIALALPAIVFAQTYPAPTFSSLTLQNPLTAANGGTGSTTSTGNGSVVLSNSPSLTTPNLGTPSAVTLTNGTGLPVSTGISGLGSGVAAGLASSATGSGGPVLSTSPTIASPTITGATISGGTVSASTITGGAINNTPIGAITPAAGTFSFVGIPALVSGATQFTLGVDPAQGGSVLWNSALSRIGGNLTLDANLGNNSNDEFLTVIEANQQATSMITLTTTASTSTSSNVLTFSSVPSTIKIGMAISDSTSVNAIQQLFVTAKTSTTVTMSGTPLSTVGSGDTIVFGFQNFKGPLYLGANCFDSSTWQFTRACNALTSYTTIQNGVTHGYAEGTVVMADAVGTGDGLMIAGEFDIGPQANSNSNHCDQSGLSNCHTNFWVANFGTVRGSWMLDSAAGGPGWNNGLALRNIAAGGLAVQIPNNTVIASTDSTGATIYNLIYAGTDNNVHVGTGATSIAADAPLNVGTYGIVATQNGSSAASGRVGEKAAHSTTGTSMTTAVTINGDSLSLGAGDWDVWAVGRCNASSASVQTCAVGLSQTSATFGSFGTFANANPGMAAGSTTTSNYTIAAPVVPITTGSSTTVYCVMSAQFSSGTMTGDCALEARRVR